MAAVAVACLPQNPWNASAVQVHGPEVPGGGALTSKIWLWVIGIDKYREWPPLKACVKDAKAVKDILVSRYHFDEVIELYDERATYENMENTIKQLHEVVGELDSLLIYYSGHGYYDSAMDTGYWIPCDAPEYSSRGYIPEAVIRSSLRGLKCRHVLLLSDSCFSGSFLTAQRGGPVFEPDNEYYKRVWSRRSRRAMTSGNMEPVADVAVQGHSPFAFFVIDALKENRSPYLTPSSLHVMIREGVTNNSPNKQEPRQGSIPNCGDGGGEFIFFTKPSSLRVTSSPSGAAVLIGSSDQEIVEDTNKVTPCEIGGVRGRQVKVTLKKGTCEKTVMQDLTPGAISDISVDLQCPAELTEFQSVIQPGNALVQKIVPEVAGVAGKLFREARVPPGRYVLTVAAPCHVSKSITLDATATATFEVMAGIVQVQPLERIALVPKAGTLSITTIPPTASLKPVSGEMKPAAGQPNTFSIPCGSEAKVEVSADGYDPQTVTVRYNADDEQPVVVGFPDGVIRLKPKPVKEPEPKMVPFDLDVTPGTARIKGITPFVPDVVDKVPKGLSILPGRYEVALVAECYEAKTVKVLVEGTGTTLLDFEGGQVRLNPTTFDFSLDVDLPDVTLESNDRADFRTQLKKGGTTLTGNVPCGDHRLTLRREGFREQVVCVAADDKVISVTDCATGSPIVQPVSLTPVTGALSFTSNVGEFSYTIETNFQDAPAFGAKESLSKDFNFNKKDNKLIRKGNWNRASATDTKPVTLPLGKYHVTASAGKEKLEQDFNLPLLDKPSLHLEFPKDKCLGMLDFPVHPSSSKILRIEPELPELLGNPVNRQQVPCGDYRITLGADCFQQTTVDVIIDKNGTHPRGQSGKDIGLQALTENKVPITLVLRVENPDPKIGEVEGEEGVEIGKDVGNGKSTIVTLTGNVNCTTQQLRLPIGAEQIPERTIVIQVERDPDGNVLWKDEGGDTWNKGTAVPMKPKDPIPRKPFTLRFSVKWVTVTLTPLVPDDKGKGKLKRDPKKKALTVSMENTTEKEMELSGESYMAVARREGYDDTKPFYILWKNDRFGCFADKAGNKPIDRVTLKWKPDGGVIAVITAS